MELAIVLFCVYMAIMIALYGTAKDDVKQATRHVITGLMLTTWILVTWMSQIAGATAK